MNYLTLDIGGSAVKYALMDDQMTISSHGSIPCLRDSMDSLLSPMRQIKDSIKEEYAGVAVSMPGKIDTEAGIAVTGGAFAFIDQAPMADIIQQIFQKPVTIANDGKCAANAELHDGALKGARSGAVVILGTGIGGGIIIDGKVWLGNDFGAGEFSLLPTMYQEFSSFDPSMFGKKHFPVWAMDCSTASLVKQYCTVKNIADHKQVDGKMFFDAYEDQEKEAVEVFRKFCDTFAVGIYTIQSILDVEKIAIGGGISARPEVTEGIRDSVQALFKKQLMRPFNQPEIVTCKFRNDANLIGALQFHLERMKKSVQ